MAALMVPMVLGMAVAPASSARMSANLGDGCMSLEGSVCIAREQEVDASMIVGSNIVEADLQAAFDFDDVLCQDMSMKNGSITPQPSTFGPGFHGYGASLKLAGPSGYRLEIAPSESDAGWSVTGWVFFRSTPPQGTSQLIACSGSNNDSMRLSVVGPSNALRLNINSRGSTSSVFLTTNAKILPRRWTHVAVTGSGPLVRVFVNGFQDAAKVMDDGTVFRQPTAWQLGGDLSGRDGGGLEWYMDELRIYNTALKPDRILPNGVSAFPGIGLKQLSLGCVDCTYGAALLACNAKSARVCNEAQLKNTGFLAVGRAMGWLDLANGAVWGMPSSSSSSPSSETAAALCCAASA